MSVKLTCGDKNLIADIIIWDRDSYFIDFEKYWARLVGAVAQKIAENTTSNWGSFNQVRTESIRILGLNPEDGTAQECGAVKILPVSFYSNLLAISLQNHLREIDFKELNHKLNLIVDKTVTECKEFIPVATLSKNLEELIKIKDKAKHFLVTNDSVENNEVFFKNSNLQSLFFKSVVDWNKEKLKEFMRDRAIFLTSNNYLYEFYSKSNFNNVLLVKSLQTLVFENTEPNNLVTVNVDGASKGNPGHSGIGVVFCHGNEILCELSEYLGTCTNNSAEYQALIRALEVALEKGFKDIQVRSDSELIVKQVNKIYKVKDADINDKYDRAVGLIEQLNSFKIVHVPREENLKADKLANLAIKKTLSPS